MTAPLGSLLSSLSYDIITLDEILVKMEDRMAFFSCNEGKKNQVSVTDGTLKATSID